ncbi:MAG: SBBP repeat-containing protein [Promethearchaeota archaeon]
MKKITKIKPIIITLAMIFFFSILINTNFNYYQETDYGNLESINEQKLKTAECPYGVEWFLTWGGSASDYGESIVMDSSDNIYFAGYTASFGSGGDICLVKYHSPGFQQSNRIWGGSDIDWGKGIAIDSSRNIYITGTTWSYGAGSSDVILVKYNSLGNLEWYRTWGGSDWDGGYDLAIDSSGDIYITGNTASYGAGTRDVCLIKYNSSGVLQWDRIWGSTEVDRSNAIALDSSENIYIIGETYGFGAKDSDMCLLKYNNLGDLEWYRIWGESGLEYGNTITIDSLDNIYVAGGYFDIALVKYDSTGVEQWNRRLSDVDCYGIALDSSENIYLAGIARYGGNHEMYLVKFSNSGIFEWDLSWGGSDLEECKAIRLDSSDNIYLAGSTWSYGAGMRDLCLVRFSKDIIAPLIPSEPEIPGYNLFFLLGILSVVATYISKKLKKSKS